MVFDYGKVIITNEREVLFMNTKTSTIENIIIEKVETYYIDLLSKLHKDMVAPMMIIRRLVRIYCENNNMVELLNEERFKNICNFLYEKYVK